jgi:hypothetical protein
MAGTIICFEALRQRRAAAAGASPSTSSANRLDDHPSPGAGFSAV